VAQKKRLLIYAHYYVPDVASTGQILHELAVGLSGTFDITVICVVPSYGGVIDDAYKVKKYYWETLDGVRVLRMRVPEFSKENKLSRVRNIVSYFVSSLAATFRVGPQDYVFSISQPPILGGLLGVWGKWIKRARFIYNIQDFNPEQAMAVDYVASRPLCRIMMALDKFSCRRSNLVITVGRDLVETLKRRFGGKRVPRYVMINNWIDERQIYPLPADAPGVLRFRERYGLKDKFVIMYSGNIGLYYDLENLLKVMERFAPGTKTPDGREVVFAFVGAGSVLSKLRVYAKEHGMTNVTFIPYQDKAELISSLNAADVHWCVNSRGIKGVSCPSKYYGIAAAGKPVLAVLESGSEVEMLIRECGSGLCCEPGDYASVEQNIRWMIAHAGSAELLEMGMRGNAHLLSSMTKDISLKKYERAILDS